ncbi:MAG: hypothetical protein ABSG46_20535 [Candidatus Binataceae bacterium]
MTVSSRASCPSAPGPIPHLGDFTNAIQCVAVNYGHVVTVTLNADGDEPAPMGGVGWCGYLAEHGFSVSS